MFSSWAHVLHAVYKPWGSGSQTYYMQHLSLFTTTFVFVMGLLFKVNGVQQSSASFQALAVMMLLLVIGFGVAWLVAMTTGVMKSLRDGREGRGFRNPALNKLYGSVRRLSIRRSSSMSDDSTTVEVVNPYNVSPGGGAMADGGGGGGSGSGRGSSKSGSGSDAKQSAFETSNPLHVKAPGLPPPPPLPPPPASAVVAGDDQPSGTGDAKANGGHTARRAVPAVADSRRAKTVRQLSVVSAARVDAMSYFARGAVASAPRPSPTP